MSRIADLEAELTHAEDDVTTIERWLRVQQWLINRLAKAPLNALAKEQHWACADLANGVEDALTHGLLYEARQRRDELAAEIDGYYEADLRQHLWAA